MANKRRAFPKRKLNPIYFIFCEGETEEVYALFLRQNYRIPILIKTKITGQNISEKVIENHLKEVKKGNSSKYDKNFLFYDFDSIEFTKRLKSIKNVTLLISNPCIELWFLLHYKSQVTPIECNDCIKELKRFNIKYKKGELNNKLQDKLWQHRLEAVKRAAKLNNYDNPSTSIYKLIEELEKLKGIQSTFNSE